MFVGELAMRETYKGLKRKFFAIDSSQFSRNE